MKTERSQSCLFCNRKDTMPVYSCCLGRMGICLECAEKARTALLKHKHPEKKVGKVIAIPEPK